MHKPPDMELYFIFDKDTLRYYRYIEADPENQQPLPVKIRSFGYLYIKKDSMGEAPPDMSINVYRGEGKLE